MSRFGGLEAQGRQLSTAITPSSVEELEASTPWVAAADGDLELLQKSIKRFGLNPGSSDENGFTFLHAAVGYCRVDVIKWLLEQNKDGEDVVVDINAKDADGDTPLHHCDDPFSAKMLVEGGADHRIKNSEGKTPLEVKEEELEEEQQEQEEDDSDLEDKNLRELVDYLRSLENAMQ